MGKLFKKPTKTVAPAAPAPPELALRRQNRKSSFKMGRTISEKRERLETANERAAARKKDKKRKFTRIASTVLGFAVFALILVCLFFHFFGSGEPQPLNDLTPAVVAKPTIEIIDENGTAAKLPARTESYIALAERDFRDAGLTPIKAIIPSGAIREVDFYVEGHPGFIKMTTDRDSAVSVEDVTRLYRYLEGLGVQDFTYIDVRIAGQGYYK